MSEALPVGWAIETVASFEPYITSGSRGWARYYSEYGSLFVRITNLTRERIFLNLSDVKFVSVSHDEAEAIRTELKVGDLLISITADIGIVGYVDQTVPVPAYINQHVACVRIDDKKADTKYLAYYLASVTAQKRFREITDTGAKTGINLGTVSKLLLVVPPHSEQQAIAKALGDVDALISSLEALIAKKRDIKQGAMQELLTGQRRLPGFAGEWKYRTIGELADTDSDNLTATTSGDFSFHYIALEDVDMGELKSHTEQVFSHAPSRARRRLVPGDVLVSTVRPNLKSHLLFNERQGNWICSTGFSVVRCRNKQLDADFLFQNLFSRNVDRQIETLLVGSNYPAINSKDVRALEVPAFDVDEQRAISKVLADMDCEITALEAKLAKTHNLKQGMMQVLLTGEVRLL